MRTSPSGAFLLGLGVCLLAATVGAAEYLVANEDQFSTALGLVQPGDEIVWRDGVYDGDDILYFEPTAHGTAEAPITFRPQTPGGVTFRGEYKLAVGGRHLVVTGFRWDNSTYPWPGGYTETAYNIINFRAHSNTNRHAYDCRVTQCEIVDYDNPVTPDTSKWIQMYGARNRFDHNRVAGKTTRGPTLVVELNEAPYEIEAAHRIDHNLFAERAWSGGVNEYETVRVGTSEYSEQNAHVEVAHNFFYRCSGEAEIVSNKACENTYAYNTFVECAGSLTLRHGRGCRVEGNVFLGGNVARSGGIRLSNQDHLVVNNYLQDLAGTSYQAALAVMNGTTWTPPANPDLSGSYVVVKDCLIAHNTIVNAAESVHFGVGDGGSGRNTPPRDNTLAANIIVSSNPPLFTLTDTPINTTYHSNLVWGAATGLPADPGLVVADPDLAPDAYGLSRPSPGSPALGRADTSALLPGLLDMDGDERPVGTRDIGADEAGPGLRPRAPLSAEEAGPYWMRASAPPTLSAHVTSSGYIRIDILAPGTTWAHQLGLDYATGLTVSWSNTAAVITESEADATFTTEQDPAGQPARWWRGVRY